MPYFGSAVAYGATIMGLSYLNPQQMHLCDQPDYSSQSRKYRRLIRAPPLKSYALRIS